MFGRKAGLAPGWESHVAAQWAHWSELSPTEQARIGEVAHWLLRKKSWEAAVGFDGFELTDDMRTLIAAQAAMLVLELDEVVYRDVEAIVVWPTTISIHRAEYTGEGFLMQEGELPVLGEAHDLHGPVLLAWDSVLAGAAQPERGSNVVYHEFAHKIDMWDGGVDGLPGFLTPDDEARWYETCDPVFDALAAGERVEPLDPYGGTNEAEFFAVVTETFFNRPRALQVHEPALYELFSLFYRQDPAQRTSA